MLSSARRFGFDRRTGIFRLALRAQAKPRANRIGNGSQNGSCEEQFAQAFAVPTLSGAWRKQLVIFSPPVVTVRGVSVVLQPFVPETSHAISKSMSMRNTGPTQQADRLCSFLFSSSPISKPVPQMRGPYGASNHAEGWAKRRRAKGASTKPATDDKTNPTTGLTNSASGTWMIRSASSWYALRFTVVLEIQYALDLCDAPSPLVIPTPDRSEERRACPERSRRESAFPSIPYPIAACTRNRFAATISSPIKIAITTTCATTNGGSFPFGASACNAGIFRNACTTINSPENARHCIPRTRIDSAHRRPDRQVQ